MQSKNPAKILEVKRVIVEGDFVVTHFHVRQNPNDRIVELWDLGQPIPEKLLNENGMF